MLPSLPISETDSPFSSQIVFLLPLLFVENRFELFVGSAHWQRLFKALKRQIVSVLGAELAEVSMDGMLLNALYTLNRIFRFFSFELVKMLRKVTKSACGSPAPRPHLNPALRHPIKRIHNLCRRVLLQRRHLPLALLNKHAERRLTQGVPLGKLVCCEDGRQELGG